MEENKELVWINLQTCFDAYNHDSILYRDGIPKKFLRSSTKFVSDKAVENDMVVELRLRYQPWIQTAFLSRRSSIHLRERTAD